MNHESIRGIWREGGGLGRRLSIERLRWWDAAEIAAGEVIRVLGGGYETDWKWAATG